MTTTEGKRATYKKRYEPGDEGLRFQELTYTGNFVGMEPVTDGIKGDRMMRERAKSAVLEKVSKEDVLRDQFSIDELNDLNNYLAWNIWDVLVMRATEGVSGMIPRQEYEILAFMHEFYRWPEFLRKTTDQVGAAGVLEIGASAKRDEEDVAKFKSLVSMYENMKAKDAAKIFDRLDMRVLVELANKMNPRRMSDILGLMSTEAAERLTIEIANRSGAIGSGTPTATELPKIEGRPNKS